MYIYKKLKNVKMDVIIMVKNNGILKQKEIHIFNPGKRFPSHSRYLRICQGQVLPCQGPAWPWPRTWFHRPDAGAQRKDQPPSRWQRMVHRGRYPAELDSGPGQVLEVFFPLPQPVWQLPGRPRNRTRQGRRIRLRPQKAEVYLYGNRNRILKLIPREGLLSPLPLFFSLILP